MTFRSSLVAPGIFILLFATAPSAPCGTPAPLPENPWNASLSFSVRESYDSNVFLQDVEPSPAGVAAARAAGLQPAEAGLGSFVTLITPRLDVSFKPSQAFNLSAFYAPDVATYHSADSEDYVAHRTNLNFSGTTESKVAWEQTNTAVYVDGSELGPTFARPGDIPAIGGIPLRDRREQFLLRQGLKLTIPVPGGFIRPVASFYYHDFRTGQRSSPTPSLFVYENYIDRSELLGGVDFGYSGTGRTALVLGYRFGSQDQYELLGADSPFDSTFHRILVGVEGAPSDGLKLALSGGPDIRNFRAGTPVGFDRGELLYSIDSSVTILPTQVDTITLLARRYEQPAFSSQSMYEDITYEANWKHRINDHWASGVGFRIYGGDWQAPVQREDWIYTPMASLSYTRDANFSAELGYTYDQADNTVPVAAGSSTAYADGREFSRSIVSLMARYCF